MSIIQQPVTENYIYQTLITLLTSNTSILSKGVVPATRIFLKYKNDNFDTFRGNGYKYTFVYNFGLSDFLNPSADTIKRAEVMSHDQMSLNFGANLMHSIGTRRFLQRDYVIFNKIYSQQFTEREQYVTSTVGYLYDLPEVYSLQYGASGITLKSYMTSVISALPGIVQQCPVDISKVQEYYPVNYVTNYTYTDLQGNTTTKTATFTAIKYTCNGVQKVLFLGTGLQEFVV